MGIEAPDIGIEEVKRGDLIDIYKIKSGVYDERVCDFVKMWSQASEREGNRGHSKKLY